MDGGNLLFERPPQQSRRGDKHTPANKPRRPQQVRDKIMKFLMEPRTVKKIAVRINRKTSTATGHIRSMHAKGLVVRLSWGVWVRSDKCTNPPDYASIRRNNPAQDGLLPHLQQPKTLAELEQITGRRPEALRSFLTKMIERGDVEKGSDKRFVVVRS